MAQYTKESLAVYTVYNFYIDPYYTVTDDNRGRAPDWADEDGAGKGREILGYQP